MIDIKTAKACPLCSYIAINHAYMNAAILASHFHDSDLPPFLPNVPPGLVDFISRCIKLFEIAKPPKRKRKTQVEPPPEPQAMVEADAVEVKKLTKAGITLSILKSHLPNKPTAAELDLWTSAVAVEFLEHLWATRDQYILTYSPETRMRYLKRRILGYTSNPLTPKLRNQILDHSNRIADQFVVEKRKKQAENEPKEKKTK